ncbi:glycosyltransferase 87 family protein [Actinomadura macrotermitis]|uniref:DUF2029 domain-containing protein n=1 Tax=Actinomadura macrotermitis TaxID=2585200 RepID=A0A7K0C4D1_9ACTN|nr:glycosyltransferase 87 family protein [Actinomadura macrotermitis]MQY08216.1 hypothetical protein [Actinomadura macrotermitis]
MPRSARLTTLAMAVSALGYTALACWFTITTLDRPSSVRQLDLNVYLGAIGTVSRGAPLYSYAAPNGDPFTYPPFALLVLWPAGQVPDGLLRLLWTLATCGAVVAMAAVAVRRAGRSRWLFAVAALLLVSAPLQSDLRFGQVSVFLVALAFADAAGVVPPRWRGVLIGLTSAIKLTPLLFIGYLLVTGQRRAAARALGVFAACGAVAAAVLPRDSLTFWTGAVFSTSRIGDLSIGGNQSLNGMLLRLPLTDADRGTAFLLLAAVACGAALYRARDLFRTGHATEAAVITGCATLAVSPVSWTHHQAWTVLAGILLFARGSLLRRTAAVAIIAVMVVPGPALGHGVLGFAAANARALCAFALCCLGLLTAWRAARTPHLLLAGRLRLRPRALAAAGGAAVLFAGGLVVTHLIQVRMLTTDDLAAPVWQEALGYTEEGGRPRTEWPEVAPGGEPVNYGASYDGETALVAAGAVGPAVQRLVLATSAGGPRYDVPLTASPRPGTRLFALSITDASSADLLAYDAAGRLLCHCGGGKLSGS